MEIREIDRFNELAESCGNRYLAVNWIAKWTRSLGNSYKDYQILESKLLTWAITGHCPYIESELEKRRVVTSYDKLEEFLCWVSDERVKTCVKEAYRQSVKGRKLTLVNSDKLNKYEISRANILLRMFWCSA